MLRFGKRDMPGVLRFGKRFTEKNDIPGMPTFHWIKLILWVDIILII